MEGAILLVGLLVVALGGGFAANSAKKFSQSIPLAGVAQDIQFHLTLSHLGLAEFLAGDTSIDVSREVFGNIDKAQSLCQAMKSGGETRFGRIEASNDATGRAENATLCKDISTLRDLSMIRISSTLVSGAGTPNAKAYDELFRTVMTTSDDDIDTMRKEITAEQAMQTRLGWLLVSILAGLFAGIAVMVHRGRRALESKTGQMTRLASIVESSDDAIIGKTRDGIITSWNPGAERLYGYHSTEVVGHSVDIIVPIELRSEEVTIRRAAAEGERRSNYQTVRVCKDGSTVPVSLTVSPIEDADGILGISTISRDITAQKRIEAELAAARLEALESSRLKSEFLATMSHEIRTPMNGVIGLNGLLLGTELTGAQRQYADGVRTAGDALMMVINDILDFSKLEAGKVELEDVPFDPRRLVDDVGALLADAAQRKQLELVAYCMPGVPAQLRGDAGRIRQVLLNLTANAVKFTAAGEVVIRAQLTQEGPDGVVMRFEVNDTGIGIAPEDRQRLFDPFSQADASTTRRYGGTGLGLAICRRLTEAMGGRMGVDGQVGQGSSFWFTIPMSLVPAAIETAELQKISDVIPGRRVLVVDDNATNRWVLCEQVSGWRMRPDPAVSAEAAMSKLREAVFDDDPYRLVVLDMCMPDVDGLTLARMISADHALEGTEMILLTSAPGVDAKALRESGIGAMLTKPARESELYDRIIYLMGADPPVSAVVPAGSAPLVKAPSRGRVLIVEDNTINQLVAEALVTKLGYQVDIVANGVHALRAVAETDYAAVLMDCYMPEMDGFEATTEIRRRDGARRHTPIIAMTAGARTEDRVRCLAAGMDDYISKPVDMAVVAGVLTRWVPDKQQPAVSKMPGEGTPVGLPLL